MVLINKLRSIKIQCYGFVNLRMTMDNIEVIPSRETTVNLLKGGSTRRPPY